jgi:hypothetical protein
MMHSMDSENMSNSSRRTTASAFLPIALFILLTAAIYMWGAVANPEHTDAATIYELARASVAITFGVLSPALATAHLVRRRYLQAVVWLAIAGTLWFRTFYYETFHDVEFFVMAQLVEHGVMRCGAEGASPSSAAMPSICYVHKREPWERYLLRGQLDELLLPQSQWPDQLTALLRGNASTVHIVSCNDKRVRHLTADLYYVELACGYV